MSSLKSLQLNHKLNEIEGEGEGEGEVKEKGENAQPTIRTIKSYSGRLTRCISSRVYPIFLIKSAICLFSLTSDR